MLADQLSAAVRHHWWLFLLRGVAAIAFGALVLAYPGATVVALMVFIAAYAFLDGLVTIGSALRMRAVFDRWWLLLIQGIISTAFGVLAFSRPGLSLIYIVISVSLWMLSAGVVQFLLGRAHKAMGGSALGSTIGAAASLGLAVAALVYPGLTIASVVVLIAWFALAIGAVNIFVAFRVRALAKALAPVTA